MLYLSILSDQIGLSVAEFEAAANNDCIILDTRTPDEYENGTVPNSINIGLNGQYAPWVGSLIDARKPLLLIANDGKETEAVLRLARVGYENVRGYLAGGINAWRTAGKKVEITNSLNADEFAKNYKTDNIIDVQDRP